MGSPAGLKNVGNTCYVNSLLQAYYAIPSFRRAVLSTTLGPSDGPKATDTGARSMRQATLEEVISKSEDTSIECTTIRRKRLCLDPT